MVFGSQTAQVQHVGQHARRLQLVPHDLRKPPALGDFPRTGAIVARRGDDHQHPRARLRLALDLRRARQAVVRFFPLHRQVVLGIRIPRSGFHRDGRFAASFVGIPRDGFQPVQRIALGLEGRIVEAAHEAHPENVPRQRTGVLSGANVELRFGHGNLPADWGPGRQQMPCPSLRNARTALLPPMPNELLSASVSAGSARAVPGT
ncbi:hypothetical protein D3C72_1639000 [compost metagenome]